MSEACHMPGWPAELPRQSLHGMQSISPGWQPCRSIIMFHHGASIMELSQLEARHVVHHADIHGGSHMSAHTGQVLLTHLCATPWHSGLLTQQG